MCLPYEDAAPRAAAFPRWINLLAPGAGLIAAGAAPAGIALLGLFAFSANLALAGWFIMPDDVPAAARGLALGAAVGAYIAAQVRLAQTLREPPPSEARGAGRSASGGRVSERVRAEALREVADALAHSDAARACRAVERLGALVDTDLLAAYRRAQALTAAGELAAAEQAWRRLDQLDEHHIYRQQIRAGLAAVRGRAAEGA